MTSRNPRDDTPRMSDAAVRVLDALMQEQRVQVMEAARQESQGYSVSVADIVRAFHSLNYSSAPLAQERLVVQLQRKQRTRALTLGMLLAGLILAFFTVLVSFQKFEVYDSSLTMVALLSTTVSVFGAAIALIISGIRVRQSQHSGEMDSELSGKQRWDATVVSSESAEVDELDFLRRWGKLEEQLGELVPVSPRTVQRRRTVGAILAQLEGAERIDEELSLAIRGALTVRNSIAHGMRIPTSQFVDGVRKLRAVEDRVSELLRAERSM